MTLSGGLSRPGERDRPIIKFMEIDWTFCLVLCLIAGAGALMLFSIAGASWEPWAAKHLMRFGIYFIIMVALAMVDLRIWFMSPIRSMSRACCCWSRWRWSATCRWAPSAGCRSDRSASSRPR
jgi:hypothetical protein